MAPCWRGWQKIKKLLYLSPWETVEKKTKGICFLKLQMPFVFLILLMGWDTAFFSFYVNHINKVQYSHSENGYISASKPKLNKLMGTLFSQTLKVWGNRVPLIFPIFAQGLRCSHFLTLCWPHQNGAIPKLKKDLYLSLRAKIALCFLKL